MAMYKAEFESSKQELLHYDLKSLMDMVKGYLRFSLNHCDIPVSEYVDPFETVRFSAMKDELPFFWHLFSMYAENDSCWGKCIVLSCGKTGNVQLMWQKEE